MNEVLYFGSRFSENPVEMMMASALVEMAKRLKYLEDQFLIHRHVNLSAPLDERLGRIQLDPVNSEAVIP